MVPLEVDQALNLPVEEAVTRLIDLPENQWFERKSGVIKPTDLAKAMVAMANAEGGVIVVGLHNGQVSPVSDQAANDLRQSAVDFTEPRVTIHVSELSAAKGRLLVFRVAPGNAVHQTTKGECFQRIGDESRRLDFVQRQELEWDRGAGFFDGTPALHATRDDLDTASISELANRLGSSSPEDALHARDLLLENNKVTVAAYLLFGKRPQFNYPNAHIRVLKYNENDRGAGRWQHLVDGADIRCEGRIPDQIAQATSVIETHIPKRRALADSGRFEGVSIIPKDAWLEGLVNAAIHRSYSMGGDHIRVEIFPNRIEITNPGRFPGIANMNEPESIRRNARNPRIARVCADLGITQELGEGIRRIFKEMRRSGLSDPMYQQHADAVRLTLMASDAVPRDVLDSLGKTSAAILDVMRRAQHPLGTGQIAELINVTRPTVLRNIRQLQEAGLVTWQGNSVSDPRATWHLT